MATAMAVRDPDAAAIERYHYLLRTAPPEALERAHAEAFARMTPEQRRQLREQMFQEAPPADRPNDDDPQTLARAATHAEVHDPGFLDRTLGGRRTPSDTMTGLMSMDTAIGGSLLSSIAGAFLGSSIAHALFDDAPGRGANAVAEDDEVSDAVGFEDPIGDFAGDYGGA